jgi:transposase-like protein
MTQQRRFTKEFEEEAVRLAQTSGVAGAAMLQRTEIRRS